MEVWIVKTCEKGTQTIAALLCLGMMVFSLCQCHVHFSNKFRSKAFCHAFKAVSGSTCVRIPNLSVSSQASRRSRSTGLAQRQPGILPSAKSMFSTSNDSPTSFHHFHLGQTLTAQTGLDVRSLQAKVEIQEMARLSAARGIHTSVCSTRMPQKRQQLALANGRTLRQMCIAVGHGTRTLNA